MVEQRWHHCAASSAPCASASARPSMPAEADLVKAAVRYEVPVDERRRVRDRPSARSVSSASRRRCARGVPGPAGSRAATPRLNLPPLRSDLGEALQELQLSTSTVVAPPAHLPAVGSRGASRRRRRGGGAHQLRRVLGARHRPKARRTAPGPPPAARSFLELERVGLGPRARAPAAERSSPSAPDPRR